MSLKQNVLHLDGEFREQVELTDVNLKQAKFIPKANQKITQQVFGFNFRSFSFRPKAINTLQQHSKSLDIMPEQMMSYVNLTSVECIKSGLTFNASSFL